MTLAQMSAISGLPSARCHVYASAFALNDLHPGCGTCLRPPLPSCPAHQPMPPDTGSGDQHRLLEDFTGKVENGLKSSASGQVGLRGDFEFTQFLQGHGSTKDFFPNPSPYSP